MKPKVIRISTVPLSLHLLLQGQLKMLAETYEVLAVSSSGEELHKVAEREGVRTCAIPMERHIAPLKDLIALIRLIILFRKEKPQIVHSLTPKAGLLAMMAARICRVPIRIHTFTGLVFPSTTGWKPIQSRCLFSLFLYKCAAEQSVLAGNFRSGVLCLPSPDLLCL